MKIVIRISIALQVLLVLTNSLFLLVSFEQGYEYFRRLDEAIFLILSIIKISIGPIAIIFLLSKVEKNIGIKLTSILFITYFTGSVVMAFLSKNPMAFWSNTFWLGQGILFAIIYLILSISLLKPNLISNLGTNTYREDKKSGNKGFCDVCGKKVSINFGDAYKTLCKDCS